MKKIRLSILTRFYPPDFAATGQLIEELANHLRKNNISVEIFTGRPGYAFSTKSAPRVECDIDFRLKRSRTSQLWPEKIWGKVFNGLFFFLRGAFHLLKAIWFHDLVMLTTEPPYLPILGYLIHRLTGFPYVCLLYDIYPDVIVKLGMLHGRHPLVRIWRWLNHQTWQHAQALIVLSPSMQAQVIRQCPKVAAKTYVIHSWCNPDEIRPIPRVENGFIQQQKLDNAFTVLYSGNMGRCHDMATIVATAREMQHEPVQFLFIGGGSKLQDCMSQVESWGLHNCRFLPYQEKGELSYSLSAADLALVSLAPGMEDVVAPSKLYSLLAAGRPIAAVCEERSYLRTILYEAGCGQGIDTGNPAQLANFIRYLMKSPERLKSMGHDGRDYFLSHFTLDIIGPQYLNVFQTALGVQPHLDRSDTDATPAPVPVLQTLSTTDHR
jgi:glycosyltransferase involved in cell wall biosynthesis